MRSHLVFFYRQGDHTLCVDAIALDLFYRSAIAPLFFTDRHRR
ncbi:hypothetical protein [Microcoleus sp. T2B6]